ncbi:hypothetical protein [Legionella jamestowniensis]|uniref:hypothetical protein n=1 Tax=Legionella jamestowniensis TaxID=455 RepID=UPI001146F62D|nr:hypothetical protein [Legionella jamestowniensis]
MDKYPEMREEIMNASSTAFAVCWQAALVLAIAYAAMLYRSYSKHKEAQMGAPVVDEPGNIIPAMS